MTLKDYDEATRLLNRYNMCGEVLNYLSDSGKRMGMAFNTLMKRFFTEFHDELLVFVNEQYIKAGMDFEDLHCECRPDDDDENSTETENPKS